MGFKPPIVGLDLGTHTVRAVALKASRKGWQLLAAGESPVTDAIPPSEAAAGLLDALNLTRARLVAALPTHAAIVKRVTLPPMSEAELARALPAQAEQFLPFALTDVQLDYQVITRAKALPLDALDVLVVAARKERVEERVAQVRATGRTPEVLDVEAFALANTCELVYPHLRSGLVVLAHVGQRSTVVCLLEDGHPVSTRDIQLGGQAYVDALCRDLGVDVPAAVRLLRQPHITDEGALVVVRDLHHQLMLELRRTLDFHRASSSLDRVERLVLSGGACRIDGLRALLASELDTEVDIIDPLAHVTRARSSVGVDCEGPAYAVAVGLAMRKGHDR